MFRVNLEYLTSHDRRIRVDRFTCTPSRIVVPVHGEDRTWSLTPIGVAVHGEDRTCAHTLSVLIPNEDLTW